MLSRAAVRATTQVAGRRTFHATRIQRSSPYHYPEGPYTNIPFDPKKKTFPILFWGYCALGFGAPFMIASASSPSHASSILSLALVVVMWCWLWLTFSSSHCSLADLQAQGINREAALSGGRLVCGDGAENRLGRPGGGAVLDWMIDIFSNRLFLKFEAIFRHRLPSRGISLNCSLLSPDEYAA